jgi:hypothetical protein
MRASSTRAIGDAPKLADAIIDDRSSVRRVAMAERPFPD